MHGLWQEFLHLDTSRKALRNFGLVVGGVLLGIAALVLWRKGWTPNTAVYILGGIGGALVVLGLIVPAVLKPLYRVWMGLALVLGFVMTRVLLTVVFFLLFMPIGLVMRLLGRDPMHRRPDPSAASYWIKRTPDASPKERLEKYY